MHITLEADYAVRIVVFLAQQNKRVDASVISAHTGVSLRFALKILRNLVGCGIARSFKGTLGGYELNRLPSEITLKELLDAVEGEYVFSRCLSGKTCTRPADSACKAREVFSQITSTVRRMLSDVTIEELM